MAKKDLGIEVWNEDKVIQELEDKNGKDEKKKRNLTEAKKTDVVSDENEIDPHIMGVNKQNKKQQQLFLKVVELKDKLRELGCPVGGSKPDLISRLVDAIGTSWLFNFVWAIFETKIEEKEKEKEKEGEKEKEKEKEEEKEKEKESDVPDEKLKSASNEGLNKITRKPRVGRSATELATDDVPPNPGTRQELFCIVVGTGIKAPNVKSYGWGDSKAPKFPSEDGYDLKRFVCLMCSNLGSNNNKYYVLEQHVSKDGPQFRLFTHYGRLDDLTDNPNGGRKECRYYDSQDECDAGFLKIYKEKTAGSKGYKPVNLASSSVGSPKARGRAAGAIGETTKEKMKEKKEGSDTKESKEKEEEEEERKKQEELQKKKKRPFRSVSKYLFKSFTKRPNSELKTQWTCKLRFVHACFFDRAICIL
ncbi:hypothetical protein RFI_18539 [Reticulomyxa filosa]|uniref:Uncharacterized protein n=1 Tax=Reticulomyxa filosa TaxID=46433 RepID=X6MYK4_RETFI|nr:hypothetical protein RFI_18539 [Reticulomyxa filosa]|eukprot:ETO18718.1 hypothetical protein RFI_18539 [Reticulomyxa filosa]